MKEKIFKWLLVSLTLFNFVFTTPILATEENGSISNCDENGLCYGYFNGEKHQINVYSSLDLIPFYAVNGYSVYSAYVPANTTSDISFNSDGTKTFSDNTSISAVRHFITLPETLSTERYYDMKFVFEYDGYEIQSVTSNAFKDTSAEWCTFINGSFDYDVNDNTVVFKYDNIMFDKEAKMLFAFIDVANNEKTIKGIVTSIVITDVTDDVLADREEEERNGLLNTIIGWIKDIYNAIVDLPINIYNALTGLFQKVVNAINSIKQWLTDLLNGILEGLKSLFIPSNEYFKNYFDELYTFFTEKLGILMLPIDIMIQVFNGIMNIENGDGFIHVPEVKYMDCVLIPKTDYDVQSAITEVMGPTYELYYLFVDVILIVMVLNMARVKFDEIVGGKK